MARMLPVVALTARVPPSKVSVPPTGVPSAVSLAICKVPALMVQGVAWLGALVSVQLLVPALLKMPKPRYCAPGPMAEVSKLELLAPPRIRVSAALKATTLPVMELFWISNTLVPPVSWMALARVNVSPLNPAVIVPLLTMVRPAPVTPMPPLPLNVPPLPPLMAPELLSVPVPVKYMPMPPSPPPPPPAKPPVPPLPPTPPLMVPELV